MTLEVVAHKEIDSIIDEAKASGLYSIDKVGADKVNIVTHNDDNFFDDHDWFDSNVSFYNESKTKSLMNDWESFPKLQCVPKIELNSSPRSDSDVTIIRDRKQRTKLKKPTNNKWENIHDKAVPGDGTHLAESPSLVNLVTFVNSDTNIKKKADEYLVPISSWDPKYTKKRNLESSTLETSNTQFEEMHHSLLISEKYESRLNISYMVKQKLSPRPGALFSQNPTTINFESDKNLQLDNNNRDFQKIKVPPCEKFQHRTIKNRLNRFARRVICACCMIEQVNRKTRNTFEIGIQAMNMDMDL